MTIVFTLLYTWLLATTVTNILYLRRSRRRQRDPGHYPTVTILIPARNEERNLRRLLPSLVEQEYHTFEVIVYDDDSEDRSTEVVRGYGESNVRLIEGGPLPEGWVGKVHALYQATRLAKGDLFLFLDADARLKDRGALARLVRQYNGLPERSVLSGLMELSGGGELIVSLIPFTMMTMFSLPIAERLRGGYSGILGGGCWLISRTDYMEHEPHKNHPDEVLEDLVIARYLKRRGVTPYIHDLRADVDIRMYESFSEGWIGFRKNSSLMGGGPVGFVVLLAAFSLIFLVIPVLWPPGIAAVYVGKLASDRFAGFSFVTTLLAPVSFLLAVLITLDSARGHLSGRVTWKGREVSGRTRL